MLETKGVSSPGQRVVPGKKLFPLSLLAGAAVLDLGQQAHAPSATSSRGMNGATVRMGASITWGGRSGWCRVCAALSCPRGLAEGVCKPAAGVEGGSSAGFGRGVSSGWVFAGAGGSRVPSPCSCSLRGGRWGCPSRAACLVLPHCFTLPVKGEKKMPAWEGFSQFPSCQTYSLPLVKALLGAHGGRAREEAR